MFPFAGLLATPSFELKVPGQDSPALIVGVSAGAAFAGIRFNPDGNLDVQAGPSPLDYNDSDLEVTDEMWIASDAKPSLFDPNDYECRFNNPTGDTGQLFGSAVSTWLNCGSFQGWYVVATSSQVNEVAGIIQVRKISDPSNTLRSGNLSLRAIELGL